MRLKSNWLFVGLLAAGIAVAGGFAINLGDAAYRNSPSAQGIDLSSEAADRANAMSQAAHIYNGLHQNAPITIGATVQFTYIGGQQETGTATNSQYATSWFWPTSALGGPCDLSPCYKNLGT